MLKKNLFTVTSFVILMLLICSSVSFADIPTPNTPHDDTTPPDFRIVSVSPSVVHPGEYLDIILDITEEESGLNLIEFNFYRKADSDTDFSSYDYRVGAAWVQEGSSLTVYKIDSSGKEHIFNEKKIFSGRYKFHIPVKKSYPAFCNTADRWICISMYDSACINESGSGWSNITSLTSKDSLGNNRFTGTEKYTKVVWLVGEHGFDDGTITTEKTNLPVAQFRVEGNEFNEKLSSDSLVESIKSLDSGEKGAVEINGNGTLPKEAFDALKGKDAEIVCYSDQYKWTFNGKDIGNNTKDVNLLIDTSSVDDNSDSLSKVDVLKLEFADNGELPGKARVAIDKSIIDTDATSDDLALYYVDGDTYIPVDASIRYEKDAGETWCSFDVSHNSTYVLATKAKIIGCKDSYTYTGKSIKPSIKIILNGKTLKAGTHYTVSYAKNKLVGTATVLVHGKGDIKGETSTKFKIVPKKTSISKVSSAKRAFTVKWKKQPAQTSGYEVRYSINPSMSGSKTKTISKNSILSKKISSLKAKRKYYVQVRTYKKVSGSKYYSSWSSTKSVKTK